MGPSSATWMVKASAVSNVGQGTTAPAAASRQHPSDQGQHPTSKRADLWSSGRAGRMGGEPGV